MRTGTLAIVKIDDEYMRDLMSPFDHVLGITGVPPRDGPMEDCLSKREVHQIGATYEEVNYEEKEVEPEE